MTDLGIIIAYVILPAIIILTTLDMIIRVK